MRYLYGGILTKEFFDKNYVKDQRSITQISDMTGAYWQTVKVYAMKNGIKLRSHKEQAAISSLGGVWKHDNLLTKRFFLHNYLKMKKSIKNLSKETGLHPSVIRGYMKKHGISARTCHEQMVLSYPPKEFKLTKQNMAFFDGLMLGDGCIPSRKYGSHRSYTQGCKHRDYLEYITKRARKYGITFSPILTKWINDSRCKKGGYQESYLQSHSYRTFELLAKRWYNRGIKHIPKDLIFTPDSILQFYLGDGNFYREIRLCTDSFSMEDVKFLQHLFLVNLSIKTRLVRNGGQYEIAIKKSDSQRFLKFIGKCPVSCYNYKWKDNESVEKKLENRERARRYYLESKMRMAI